MGESVYKQRWQTAEIAAQQAQKRLTETEEEVRALRRMLRVMGGELKRSVLELEVESLENPSRIALTIRSSAGEETEKIQARILAGVYAALCADMKVGEVGDKGIAPESGEDANGA